MNVFRLFHQIFLTCSTVAIVGLVVAVSTTSAQHQCEQLADQPKPPYVSTKKWLLPPSIDNLDDLETTRVISHNRFNESLSFCDAVTGEANMQFDLTQIGHQPQFWDDEAVKVLNEASHAYRGGMGVWTSQYTPQQRIDVVRKVFADFLLNREHIVQILMWEISKNKADAEAEVDETLEFLDQLALTILSDPEYMGQWNDVPGSTTTAFTKRSALGVVLIIPYSYPITDTYRLLLPALLTGNICILKLNMIGGLVHIFTMELFAKHLPPGALYFISSPGPMVLPAMLETGKVDALAVIGTAEPTDEMILTKHSHPHKLKTFLQLGAKNMAIVLPDLFERSNAAVLENALLESVQGSLAYSGQLSTALKIYFVPKRFGDTFALKIAELVETVPVGQPWQTHVMPDGSTQYSQVTPIPNYSRLHYLMSRIEDATRKGARIINANGGAKIGGSKTSLLSPAVLYPVKPNMMFYKDESEGPIILIATYDDLDEAIQYGENSEFAQQISVFGQDVASITKILDRLGSIVGRINLNSQCTRAPDTVPFTARRSSGMGVMSVTDILKEFTVPTVIAHKSHELNDQLVEGLSTASTFLSGTKKATAK
jgi:glyceraldehyde-3-phosphate dehydrogenase (NADP+)